MNRFELIELLQTFKFCYTLSSSLPHFCCTKELIEKKIKYNFSYSK